MTNEIHAGVDGGGTGSTLVLANGDGGELARVTGSAGLVDPRHPERSAQVIAALVRDALAMAGRDAPVAALCAGLAGVGNEAERSAVERALADSGVAARVRVVTDGEIALEGALGGGAGVLLIAGTGSVAYGRGADGRVERCGGWGMIVGDEGSGFALGREGLRAALFAADGRGAPTRLLDACLSAIGAGSPREIPPWAGRAEKSQIAALARVVIDAAEAGDAVADGVLDAQARGLAEHVRALASRLAPWPGEIAVVFHGGVLHSPRYASRVEAALGEVPYPIAVRPPRAEAVHGALAFARRLAGTG